MKLVQNLPEIFEEFGEKKREAFLEIKEYKDKGNSGCGDVLRLFSDRTCDGGGSNSGRTLFFF